MFGPHGRRRYGPSQQPASNTSNNMKFCTVTLTFDPENQLNHSALQFQHWFINSSVKCKMLGHGMVSEVYIAQ